MPALAVAVAVALVVALPAASGPRVPGLALRFGESLGRVDSTRLWRAEVSGGSGIAVRSGTARFFGVPAQVRLRFEGERLARAEATVEAASPRDQDFVRDELRRLGMRPACDSDVPGDRRCTWTGRSSVRLEIVGGTLTAVLEPVTETAIAPLPAATPDPAGPPPRPEGPPPSFVLGDSVAAMPFPLPEVIHRPEPVYPPIAREAGVMGRVRVLAMVDTSGAVTATRIVRSIPMLDAAASACVRRWRFRPYALDGRRWPFQIEVPVVFTLR